MRRFRDMLLANAIKPAVMMEDPGKASLSSPDGMTPFSERKPLAEEDEQALVRRAQGGDQRAFEQLYRRHVARIHGLCLRLLQDAALAEDCVQETFINAWRHLGRFEARASLSTWLHRIAVNAALARTRGRELFALNETEHANSADLADVGAQLDVEQALAGLPPGARHVLVLLGVYGHTHEEAAEMLGIAVGTCKAQLHRARRLIARQLELKS